LRFFAFAEAIWCRCAVRDADRVEAVARLIELIRPRDHGRQLNGDIHNCDASSMSGAGARPSNGSRRASIIP